MTSPPPPGPAAATIDAANPSGELDDRADRLLGELEQHLLRDGFTDELLAGVTRLTRLIETTAPVTGPRRANLEQIQERLTRLLATAGESAEQMRREHADITELRRVGAAGRNSRVGRTLTSA